MGSPGHKCCHQKTQYVFFKQITDTGVGSNEHKSKCLPVFGTDVRHNVLVEEFEDEGDAVGKHQVLSHIIKLFGM